MAHNFAVVYDPQIHHIPFNDEDTDEMYEDDEARPPRHGPPNRPRCSFYLEAKKRSCRMLAKKGNLYCGEHSLYDVDCRDRVPCPNDVKHSVARKELDAHLKVCNSRIPEAPYIKANMNCVEKETKFREKIDRRPTPEELSIVLFKIDKCYETIADVVKEEHVTLPELDEMMKHSVNPTEEQLKHHTQHSSIIGHMDIAKLIPNSREHCIFELGAGKAQLAYVMAQIFPEERYLLVDRSGSRNKFDNRAKKENEELDMKRIRCAIEHLDLSKVDFLKDNELAAMCKHLCGTGTDAGIRCLMNGVNAGIDLQGFVLVPCCHHKSRLVEYTGREFLKEWDMDNPADFAALRNVASWAVSGHRGSTESSNEKSSEKDHSTPDKLASQNLEEKKAEVEPEAELVAESGDGKEASSYWQKLRDVDKNPYWKEEMGKRAKRILEVGRARYLTKQGFRTKVVQYVPETISPENLLILGVKDKHID